MNKYIYVLLLVLPVRGFADCTLPIDQSLVTLKNVNGEQVYVVAKEYVEQLDCLDLEQIATELKRVEQLESTLGEYQSLAQSLENNIQRYSAINAQLNQTLDRSTLLNDKYSLQVKDYDRLSREFDELAGRYDKLTDKYRDIALGRSSSISLDAGIGMNEDSDVIGIIGVGIKNLKIWGLMQDKNHGVLVGGSFPF
jgi:hypothetical protein